MYPVIRKRNIKIHLQKLNAICSIALKKCAFLLLNLWFLDSSLLIFSTLLPFILRIRLGRDHLTKCAAHGQLSPTLISRCRGFPTSTS